MDADRLGAGIASIPCFVVIFSMLASGGWPYEKKNDTSAAVKKPRDDVSDSPMRSLVWLIFWFTLIYWKGFDELHEWSYSRYFFVGCLTIAGLFAFVAPLILAAAAEYTWCLRVTFGYLLAGVYVDLATESGAPLKR